MRNTIVKAPQYTDLGGMAALMGNGGAVGAGYGGPTNSQFGPGIPPAPRPIGGDPRLTQGRPGWNLPTLPGEGRLIDYGTLRAVAKIDPMVRKAISVRKDQMTDLQWDLIARDRKSAKKARETVRTQQAKIDEIKTWMDKPDGRLSWNVWLRRIMEDHLVVDGVALYKRRNLDPDAGPISVATSRPMGKLLWIEQLDATTIKPLRDTSQREPLPPLDAYQQFLFGLPVWGFTSEELIYAVKDVAVETPYGYSAVEQFLTLINLNLRYWSSMNAIYTDGTLPEGIVTAPEGWTPAQIGAFADNWNKALAGDPRALRKLHMAPHGVGWIAFKEHMFDEKLARFLVDILAVAFDLTPAELGYEPSHGGLGGKGLAEGQERVQERRGVGPTVRFICDSILNPILWDEWGMPDLEFAVVDRDTQDEEQRAKAEDIDLRNGRISLDELIERDGGEPPGVGRLFVLGPTTVLGEPDLIKLTTVGAGALGIIKPVAVDEDGLPVQAAPPAAIGPDGKPMTDPKTGEPLQHPTLGPDGTPLKLPMKPGTGAPAAAEPVSATGKPAAETPPNAQKSLDDAKKIADPDLMFDDMQRWQLKAMRAFRRGKTAGVPFVSDYIPDQVAQRVVEKLTKATSPDEIRAAFIDPDFVKSVVAASGSPAVDEVTRGLIAELTKATTALVDSASREKPPAEIRLVQPITVEMPKAADIHVRPAPVYVQAPEAPKVEITNEIKMPEKDITVRRTKLIRDAGGNVVGAETAEG